MAIELAEMYVSVIPEARGVSSILSRQFRPAQGIASAAGRQSGEQFTSSFESRTSRLGQGLATVLKAGVAAAAVGVGAAGMVGIKTAAQLETAQIGFTTMLGSAKKARSFLGELGKFAEKTPFDLPGLQESASSLVSIGIDSKKVIPIMTSLGNVTSGMGTGAEGIKRATTAIQQMNAAGKISAEDLNQLRDAGVPVYDLLTAATGKTTAQISEMRDKGELGRKELEALMTALETGKGLERFNGLMEKQSQSLTGLWSTAKDVFSVGMANAIKPLIPLIKDGLVGATDLLSTVVLPKIQAGLKAVVGFGDRVIKAKEVLQAGGINSDVAAALGITGRTSEIFQEALGSIRAFANAWKYNDGEITSSGFAGYMERAGYVTRQLWESLKTLDFSSWNGFLSSLQSGGGQAGAAIASIGDSFVTLMPAFKEFATSVPSLANGGLQILAGAFAFLAEHVDTIIKYMPLLVAGFVAWKVAALANAALGRQSAAGMLLQLAGQRQLTKSNYALAASQQASTAATAKHTATQRVGLVTRLRSTAATVGHKIALIASTVATKAATLAQKGLNLVLKRNPIGLIITAVAALVAGLVWFFTKTEIGQKIVRKAWAAIKAGVSAVVGWFKNTALPFLNKLWDVIGAGAEWLYEEKILPAWRGIKRAASVVVDWFRNKALPFLNKLWDVIGAGAEWLYEEKILPAWRGIKRAVSAVVDWFKNTLAPGIEKVVDGVGAGFSWLWKEIVRPVFRKIGDLISGVWRDGIKPTFKALADFILETIPNAFRDGVRGIKGFWENLKSIAKKPIKFMVDTVYNKGIRGVFNTVMDFVGSDIRLPKLNIKGFEKGGLAPRGWAMVGEAGPELVNFTNPGRVYTADQTKAALGAPMPGTAPHIWGPVQQAAKRTGVMDFLGLGGFPTGMLSRAASAWNGLAGVTARAGKWSGGLGANDVTVNWAAPYRPGVIGYYSGQNIGMVPSGPNHLATLVHEMGHALGISHNLAGKSVMNPVLGQGGAYWPTNYDAMNLRSIYGPPGPGAKPGRPGDGGGFDLLGWIADKITAPIKSLISGLVDKIPGAGRFLELAGAVGKYVVKSVKDWAVDKVMNFGGEDARDKGTSTGTNKFGVLSGTLHDDGGKVMPGTTLIDNRLRKPEALLNPAQWSTAHRAMDAVERQSTAHPLPDIYVQNPFTGEWMLAKVDERVKAGQTAWTRDQLARRNGGGR